MLSFFKVYLNHQEANAAKEPKIYNNQFNLTNIILFAKFKHVDRRFIYARIRCGEEKGVGPRLR